MYNNVSDITFKDFSVYDKHYWTIFQNTNFPPEFKSNLIYIQGSWSK